MVLHDGWATSGSLQSRHRLRVTIDFQYGAGAGARAAQSVVSVVSVVSVSGMGERSTLVLMVP